MKTQFIILTLILLISRQVNGADPVAKIIDQKDSPVEITNYTAKYILGGQYTSEGIRHSVNYKNRSEKTIVAIQFGLVSFDVWNEFLDRTGGMDLTNLVPGGESKGTWVANAYADFSFLTGFAYVRRVRFSDGTIWNADLDAITEELRKIESDFDVQELKAPEKK